MARLRTLPRLLYFIDGPKPSEDDLAAAVAITEYDVAFRNAQLVPGTGALENCQAVAGCVPPTYRHLPTVGGEELDAGDAMTAKPEKQPVPIKEPVTPAPNPGAGWKPNA